MRDDELFALIDEPERRSEVSALELAEAFLERTERLNPLVNAILTVTPDVARADARRADEARSRGEPLPLDGLPIAVKDNIDLAGVRCTVGSKTFESRIADEDAEVVRRLRAAGAVVLGKALLHEFAYGGTTNNPWFGPCRNPWNTDLIPGGSSGGSGAALGADLAIGALGSDTGGSGRIPAHLNGVVGLRPTFGAVSNRGSFPIGPSFDTITPMARSVLDVARMYVHMAGYDPGDPRSAERAAPDALAGLEDGVRGLRIGVAGGYFREDIEPEIEEFVDAAADVLAEMGAELVEVEVPGAAEASQIGFWLVNAEGFAIHRERLETHPELIGEDTNRRLRQAEALSGADVAGMVQRMLELRVELRRLFERVDLVLSPTGPVLATPIEGAETIAATAKLGRFTYAWSVAAVPAASLPCGITSGGLPLGMQLAAPWWGEPLLLRAGAAYQSVTDWHRRRPPALAESPPQPGYTRTSSASPEA